ncbi:DUF6879 family protein [Pseudonocardia spinosispora]|uniref:DUF6879 family protein n=1 Tax=Pseudonocardia spinosispora TaxID=103441 RepID=UPI0004226A5A|nr:DUF6879 family protein [Pseudonocardia spinosispora]
MTKVLRAESCDVGQTCARIDRVEGSYEIVGTHVPDAGLPAHERKVRVPATMLPELGPLDIPDFSLWQARHRRAPGDMIRVQTLNSYAVASDDADFVGYLNGAPEPTSPFREPWFKQIRDELAMGMRRRNLTVVNGWPSDYRRYGFEWVCQDNVDAGQETRVLDLVEHPSAAMLLRTGDFWVVESKYVVLVRYDDDGRHLGEVAVEDSGATGYVAAAELAWHLGTPFTEWWAAHPEYRRGAGAA